MKALFQDMTVEEAVKLIKPPKRNDIIKQFVDTLNDEIKAENERNRGYKGFKSRKLWSPSFIAFKLSHLKRDDLFYFLSLCKSSKCFGKCFWGSLKLDNK